MYVQSDYEGDGAELHYTFRNGPKISVFFEIVGPGGPKFSAKISVWDQIFQDQNSSDSPPPRFLVYHKSSTKHLAFESS